MLAGIYGGSVGTSSDVESAERFLLFFPVVQACEADARADDPRLLYTQT